MPKRTITGEEKQQIYALYQQGLKVGEIAEQMRIENPQQVAGVIRAAINFDKLPGQKQNPPREPKFPPMAQPAHMSGAATLEAPPPAAPMFSQPPPPPPPAPEFQQPPPPAPRPVVMPRAAAPQQPDGDGFSSGWSQVQSYTGGFNNQNLQTRYLVYRDEPADGIVGEHTSPFAEVDLAKTYGRGLYRVQRFDPGNPRPYQTSVRVSEAYGESRFPNRENSAPARPNWGRFGRPNWQRPQESRGQEEEVRPVERPSIFEYGRHSAPASGDAAVEAIKQMGEMNRKSLELTEATRRQGPDNFITKFFNEQQMLWQRQLEEGRRQDDQRRRDEEEKWERRQKEAELEHRRRQEEEEKRHDRDIQRIKAEAEARSKEAEAVRKQLMDVEAAKLKVVEEQNRVRELALKDELTRNREHQKEQQTRLEAQLKDMAESTASQMQEHQERLSKELERERQQLEREQKLKEKSLDKEHELQAKILDIKGAALENQSTNEIFQVVNNVINKFSSGLNQIIELKKMEAAATPETQAALVMKGHQDQTAAAAAEKKAETPGSVPATGAAATASAAPQPEKGKNGNGQAAGPAGENQEVSMKAMIREMIDKPFFKEVIDEWAMHVENEQDGTTFLNMYREWMCDPNDPDGRKATTMFANFIAPRTWEQFYEIIKDKLDKKVQAIFDLPHAKVFYETFRGLLTEQIRAFWEEFAQQREALNAARKVSQNGAEAAVPARG
jgi:hypothetical protein